MSDNENMNLIERFSKYHASRKKSTVENCLTECLAECFRQYPTFLEEFCNEIGVEKPDNPIISSHNRRTHNGNQIEPDIEISIRDKKKGIVIEVKWDSRQTKDQLSKYKEYLDKEYNEKRLIYLTKYGSYDECADKCISWLDIFRLGNIARKKEKQDQILLNILINYLEENEMSYSEIEDITADCANKSLKFYRFCTTTMNHIGNEIKEKFKDIRAKDLRKNYPFENQYIVHGRIGSFFEIVKDEVSIFYGFVIETKEWMEHEREYITNDLYNNSPWVAVWLEIDPEKREKYKTYDGRLKSFPENNENKWVYGSSDYWFVLFRLCPLKAFIMEDDPQGEIKKWIMESFDNLNDSGLFKIKPTK